MKLVRNKEELEEKSCKVAHFSRPWKENYFIDESSSFDSKNCATFGYAKRKKMEKKLVWS